MINITADHEGGCLDRAVKCAEDFYALLLRPDTWYYFNFKITGCKGKNIIFQFMCRDNLAPDHNEGRHRWLYGGYIEKPLVSYDNGKSFTDPVTVPISSPHGPCVLSDGTILYVGRLFDDVGKESHIECHTVSEDGKCTFRSRIADISPELLSCEPHAIQLSSGRIVVHIRVQDNKGKTFTTYQSISDDMGYTFTKPVQLLGDKGGAPAHILEHSSGAVVSVYGYREKPYGIRAMISKDNCESFDTDLIITDEEPTPDLGYPASAELSDGSILTVYYTRDSKTSASVIKQIIWRIEE